MGVDPTEFLAPPFEDPNPRVEIHIPSHMLTQMIYGNGLQASPTGIAAFSLRCPGFGTKVTCPVLDLADELNAVLDHKCCREHKLLINYRDE